jgi:hypothetical protein
MMEALRTSETSADNYFTRQYIPEYNSKLHTLRRENLNLTYLKNANPPNSLKILNYHPKRRRDKGRPPMRWMNQFA